MGLILLSLLLRYCVSNVEGSCASGSASTCDACLSQSPRCAWCTQENFTNWLSVGERCDTPETLLEKGCLPERLEFHVSHTEVLVDGPLGRRSGTTNSTQISPQRMALKLRPGIPMTFQVRVQQTEDYPVDIYYLMDLSASMTDDLEMIKDLGSTLTREMSNLTSKFSLGFGSFVEKPVLPFIKITEEELANPCRSVDTVCPPTFGYKHVLSLTSNTGMFNQIISKQRISANIDVPEGGFDAIMQAAVCADKIGWRNDSMRLLVFASDADSHFGMDSKMAGIVIPNDGQCHLDENNDYSMSALLEYPTLGQLIDKLVENNILLIFAVTENQKHNYENYANLIPGATVGVLASDSRNILELIVTAYKELRSEIELEVLGDTEELQMAFTSICPDGSVYPGLKRCSSIKAGDTVVFNVSVELTSCLPAPGRFLLRPVGYQDGLLVDLSSLCSCNCSPPAPHPNTTTTTTTTPTSSTAAAAAGLCHEGQGSPECGVCVCRPGFVGSQCECSEEEEAVTGGSQGGCRASEDEGGEACGGQGECFCGRCVCHASSYGRVYGRYCECDDYSCVRFRGELCGGHGQCDCGQCVCDSGWLGEYCNCSSSTESCLSQDGTSCSGRGHCDCGQCVCSVPGASGKLCEKCPTCRDTCTSARACVECHLQAKDSLDLCVQRCSVPKITINTSTELDQRHATQCTLKTDSDCFISFSIVMGELGTSAHNLHIYDCPEPPNVVMITVGVSLSVLLLGLALLVVWKVLVSVHDRKEVARFEAERSNAKWQSGTNPLFRSSTSTFKNVTYKNTGRDKSITLGRY